MLQAGPLLGNRRTSLPAIRVPKAGARKMACARPPPTTTAAAASASASAAASVMGLGSRGARGECDTRHHTRHHNAIEAIHCDHDYARQAPRQELTDRSGWFVRCHHVTPSVPSFTFHASLQRSMDCLVKRASKERFNLFLCSLRKKIPVPWQAGPAFTPCFER